MKLEPFDKTKEKETGIKQRCGNCRRLEILMQKGFCFWCVAWGMWRTEKSFPIEKNCWYDINDPNY
jgi:hypothetical protein